jgi:protein-S-isoprenylcysteine O-methyltransferase Ste14
MNFGFNVTLSVVTFVVVMLCWFAFAAMLIKRQRITTTADAKRDRASDYGLALQGLGYLVVWVVTRELFTPIVPNSRYVSLGFAVLAMSVAVGSVVIIIFAINTLGREWSVKARLIEGHKLVTHGPYHWVRHPIYTGMLGMLIATGLAISRWPALLIGIAVFMCGTLVRIKSEERLLRGAFGPDFDNYSRRVSAILPGII